MNLSKTPEREAVIAQKNSFFRYKKYRKCKFFYAKAKYREKVLQTMTHASEISNVSTKD